MPDNVRCCINASGATILPTMLFTLCRCRSNRGGAQTKEYPTRVIGGLMSESMNVCINNRTTKCNNCLQLLTTELFLEHGKVRQLIAVILLPVIILKHSKPKFMKLVVYRMGNWPWGGFHKYNDSLRCWPTQRNWCPPVGLNKSRNIQWQSQLSQTPDAHLCQRHWQACQTTNAHRHLYRG